MLPEPNLFLGYFSAAFLVKGTPAFGIIDGMFNFIRSLTYSSVSFDCDRCESSFCKNVVIGFSSWICSGILVCLAR